MSPNDGRATSFAWQVHSAQEAWTAKVDVKASVLTAAQMGLVVAGLAAFLSDAFQESLGPSVWVFGVGVLLVLIGAAFAASAIYPSLTSEPGEEFDLIYFGHLRERTSGQVATALEAMSQADEVQALSRQLIAMSRLNWAKHVRLQRSIWLSAAGLCVAIVGLLITVSQ